MKVKGTSKCKVCIAEFRLSTMGKSALMDHSGGKNISLKSRKWKKKFLPVNKAANKISSSVSSQSAQQGLHSFVYTSQTVAAEIIWSFKTVSSGHSLRSNESVVDCFKKMFPDNEIAKNIPIGKSKSMYLIKHGITPYSKNLLEADIKKYDCYVISYHESLNEKTQMYKVNAYICYETSKSLLLGKRIVRSCKGLATSFNESWIIESISYSPDHNGCTKCELEVLWAYSVRKRW